MAQERHQDGEDLAYGLGPAGQVDNQRALPYARGGAREGCPPCSVFSGDVVK